MDKGFLAEKLKQMGVSTEDAHLSKQAALRNSLPELIKKAQELSSAINADMDDVKGGKPQTTEDKKKDSGTVSDNKSEPKKKDTAEAKPVPEGLVQGLADKANVKTTLEVTSDESKKAFKRDIISGILNQTLSPDFQKVADAASMVALHTVLTR